MNDNAAKAMFALLFGTEEFEPLIGVSPSLEARTAEHEMSAEETAFRQLRREVDCAAFLADKLQPYVEGAEDKAAFCRRMGEFAVSLANTPIGLLMLRVVGESYAQRADIFRAAPHEEVARRVGAFAHSTARNARVVTGGVAVLGSLSSVQSEAKKKTKEAKEAKEAEAAAAAAAAEEDAIEAAKAAAVRAEARYAAAPFPIREEADEEAAPSATPSSTAASNTVPSAASSTVPSAAASEGDASAAAEGASADPKPSSPPSAGARGWRGWLPFGSRGAGAAPSAEATASTAAAAAEAEAAAAGVDAASGGLLGKRVVLSGLNGRPELNGCDARWCLELASACSAAP